MMPGMDGPTTLTHLRRDPRTADIPVLFMTARAQAREVAQFIALGAQGVISKPFDPMTLASAVRNHLQSIRLEALRTLFVRRAKDDAATLAACRSALCRDASPATIGRICEIAHGLAGAAGLFGYGQVSRDAAALEEEAIMAGRGARADANAEELTQAIDRLLSRLEDDWETPPTQFARSARA
jgi:CheY-like chemotaxis protein